MHPKNHDKTPMSKMILAFNLSLKKYLRHGCFLEILPYLDVSYGNLGEIYLSSVNIILVFAMKLMKHKSRC